MSDKKEPSLPSIGQVASAYEKCYEEDNRKVMSVKLISSIPKLRKWVLEYHVSYVNSEGEEKEEYLIGKIFSVQEKGLASYGVLQYLWEHGMGIEPSYTIIRPIAYFESCLLLLMTKAPGKTLSGWFLNDNGYNRIASRVADWLRCLHSIPAVKLRETKQKRAEVDISRFYKDLVMLMPEKEERLKVLYNGLLTKSEKPWTGQKVMLHGDFHLENLFVDDKQVTAIDFDHHFLGDPAWDVAYLSCQMQLKGFLRKGNFYYFQPFVKSFVESYLRDYPEQNRSEFYNRFHLYRARSLFESLHYELCVLKTGKLDMVDEFLNECELSLKGDVSFE